MHFFLLLFALHPEAAQAFDQYIRKVEAFAAPTPRNASFEVHDGLIHDWTASAFVPNVPPEKVIALLQDYGRYKDIYPEVVSSRVVSSSGGKRFHTFLKLRKKKVLTVMLDSEYDVEFIPEANGIWRVVSRSTRIDESDGGDHGFLWRLNSYWIIRPERGGTQMECRAVSLSRDVPMGLGWAVKPIVKEMPRESLQATVEATRRAALQ